MCVERAASRCKGLWQDSPSTDHMDELGVTTTDTGLEATGHFTVVVWNRATYSVANTRAVLPMPFCIAAVWLKNETYSQAFKPQKLNMTLPWSHKHLGHVFVLEMFFGDLGIVAYTCIPITEEIATAGLRCRISLGNIDNK